MQLTKKVIVVIHILLCLTEPKIWLFFSEKKNLTILLEIFLSEDNYLSGSLLIKVLNIWSVFELIHGKKLKLFEIKKKIFKMCHNFLRDRQCTSWVKQSEILAVYIMLYYMGF